MINDYWIKSGFGIGYINRIVQANMMGIGCWIESVYWMKYSFRIVKPFRICTGKI